MLTIEPERICEAVDQKKETSKTTTVNPAVMAEVLDELEMYLEPDSPTVIRHPLVTCAGYNRNQTDVCEMIVEQYWQKREALDDALSNEEWVNVVILHEPCFRFDALREYQGMMDDAEYWRCVQHAWTLSGCFTDDQDFVRGLFAPGDRTTEKRLIMMDEEERKVYDDLPDSVGIYRGCGSANRAGWSWTTRREKGEWFARRLADVRSEEFSGLLLTGRCSKKDIIAYFDSRDEAEIVIDPDDVTVSESVRLDETA